MSSTLMAPFSLRLDLQTGSLDPHTTRIERRVSSLRGQVADAAALERLAAADDPVVYEVLQRDVPEEVGQLICCTTVIHPGAIGPEYHMTKGHFHAERATGEMYLTLAGRGILLLQTEEGDTDEQPMEPGTVAYVPPGWAHRSVNTGEEPLVFFAVYPGQAGHDYGTIEQTGFLRRVVRTPEGPAVVRAGEA